MYDRTQAGMLPLDAFEIESMRPEEFRTQVRNTFDLRLTIGELTAIIKSLNKLKPEEENVNCASFLVFFIRLGHEERNKKLRELMQEQKVSKELSEKKTNREMEEFEEKNALKKISENELKFTKNDRDSAFSKLREAAKLYIMRSKGTISLKSFEVSRMIPHEFKEQMRRVFKIVLSNSEMGSILEEYKGKINFYRKILHKCYRYITYIYCIY